jgi:3-isopropylmalate/(R)-2-methylmalate dehydratase small subunit
VLNIPPFNEAKVLIAGSGFGCGSSREQAVWALTGQGIHCVIAPSFGEIFASNALKNGLLPLVLSEEQTAELGARAEAGAIFTVDLENRVLKVDGEVVAPIGIPEGSASGSHQRLGRNRHSSERGRREDRRF